MRSLIWKAVAVIWAIGKPLALWLFLSVLLAVPLIVVASQLAAIGYYAFHSVAPSPAWTLHFLEYGTGIAAPLISIELALRVSLGDWLCENIRAALVSHVD